MEDGSRAKRFLKGGAVVGGIISLAIALLMDTMYADTLQGTWRDAIAKDLNTFLSLGLSSGSVIVYLFFFFILGLLTAFGSLMGFIFSFFLYKFFGMLSK
ncbi:MAG: hypothetical protein HZB33_03470 [Nitrospirae bacterium]|nr:hypothetical protein [Nitrospirota bacterium]